MSATHAIDSTTTSAPVLYVAFELGWTSWKLAFTVGMAQKPRLRSIPARDIDTLIREIRDAKRRFHLPETSPVISCYEAGRDGFWLHRFLASKKIENLIVDSASIGPEDRPREPEDRHFAAPSTNYWAKRLSSGRPLAHGSRHCVPPPRRHHTVFWATF
jgi:hypothetical protein